MKNHALAVRIMAVLGTVLVALPVLAPLVLGVASLATGGGLRIDWLMPAELFPMVSVGVLMLLAASWMSSKRRWWFTAGAVAMLITMFGGQAIAVWTGLADGSREPTGWPWVLVTAMIGLYALLVAGMAVEGGLLSQDLFRRSDKQPPQALTAP